MLPSGKSIGAGLRARDVNGLMRDDVCGRFTAKGPVTKLAFAVRRLTRFELFTSAVFCTTPTRPLLNPRRHHNTTQILTLSLQLALLLPLGAEYISRLAQSIFFAPRRVKHGCTFLTACPPQRPAAHS